MRPRRRVFALDYLRETVEAYSVCVQEVRALGSREEPLLKWATDVLEMYFEVTDEHPAIRWAKDVYATAHINTPEEQDKCVPYRRATPQDLPTFDQILVLAKQRRSVRWFVQKPVPREIIDKALLVALQSPSACNRQPFHFRIFDDPALVKKVGSIPMGTKGFVENFPAIVVLVGQLSAFPFARDRHVIYIDASLAAMAFQFALEVQGVSSCCINWPDITAAEAAMVDTLQLNADERVVMLIALGYADSDGMVPYSQKKSLDEVRNYNAFQAHG